MVRWEQEGWNGLTEEETRLAPPAGSAAEAAAYQAMDEKLRPVTQRLRQQQPELALDTLRALRQKGVFQETELWRVYQRAGIAYNQMMEPEKVAEAYWQAVTHPAGMPLRKQQEIYSDYLFTLHYLPQLSDEEFHAKHFLYDALVRTQEKLPHPRARHRHAKLRIGYLAPFFIENVTSYFLAQLLTLYDRDRFEVYCYSLWPDHDHLTEEFERSVRALRTFPTTSFRTEVAQAIYDDEIDILFDIGVHTMGGRTCQVLGYRPAPVQVAGIGYMSTSGMSDVDYFLTDRYLDPPGMHDADFSETLIRLPQSHFCYTPPEQVLRAQGAYHVHAPVVFGSFNKYEKLNVETLSCWREILRRVPEAHFLLKNTTPSPREERVLRRRLEALGFPPSSYTLERGTHDYLARYRDVDIILDAYPYVGGATTCDALLLGVPVLTRYGARHGERFGLSLVANVGHPELAAATEQAYIEKAVALARDPERMRALHASLPQEMRRSPVMDFRGYVRAVEQAYDAIWQRWLLTH